MRNILLTSHPTQELIYYWEWKQGWSLLNSSQLRLALEYAELEQKQDVEYLQEELAKRYVGGNPHISHC